MSFNRKLMILLGIVTLFTVTGPPASAETANFKDVRSDHWAYSTIQWGVNNGVVQGYPDGTFRPNKQVSEAEFLMMLVQAYQMVDTSGAKNHWADPVYQVATNLNWPVVGSGNSANSRIARDTPITRGEVANIITGAKGVNFIGNDAIEYLLKTNLSSGKTDATVIGYKGKDYLTRAEAIVFIKRAKDQGLTDLKERPKFPTPKDEIPKGPAPTLPKGISGIKDSISKTISGNSKYSGYTVAASGTDVTIKDGNGLTSASYATAKSSTGYNSVISFKATNDASLELAIQMLKDAGVPAPSGLIDTLKSAIQSGEVLETTMGGYKVYIEPGQTNLDYIAIKFKKL